MQSIIYSYLLRYPFSWLLVESSEQFDSERRPFFNMIHDIHKLYAPIEYGDKRKGGNDANQRSIQEIAADYRKLLFLFDFILHFRWILWLQDLGVNTLV